MPLTAKLRVAIWVQYRLVTDEHTGPPCRTVKK